MPNKNARDQDSESLQRQILFLKGENERLRRHADKLAFAAADKDKKIIALQQYEYSFRKANEQKTALEASNRQHQERIGTLLSENEQARKTLEELYHVRREKQEALDEIAALYAQFDVLKKMYADAQAQNHKVLAIQEEAEVRLRVAQKHLAKKVKETSELSDKMRGLELQLQELQDSLDKSDVRCAEQQQALESRIQMEKRLQEQLQEVEKSADVAAAKWEEKYFRIYEKWQENELRLKELKKLEEKYAQMQALLTSFGSLLGGNAGGRTAAFPFIPAPCIQADTIGSIEAGSGSQDPCQGGIGDGEEKRSYAGPYQDLFEMPRQFKRPKETFFD